MERTKKKRLCCGSGSSFGMWLAIGVVLGLLVFDNIAIGIAIGVALGVSVGRKRGGGCSSGGRGGDQDERDNQAPLGSPEDFADPEDSWQ